MKLRIERAALLKSLQHMQSVVERRNTIPILSNVRIDAAKGHLALNATDMDIEIAETTAAEVSKAGATTVPAHTLYDIVRKLPDGAQVEVTSSSYGGQIALGPIGRANHQGKSEEPDGRAHQLRTDAIQWNQRRKQSVDATELMLR